MRINTNVAALTAHRNLSKTGDGLNKSIERLSSGLRINRAGDDAAGLVISQKLRAEASGLRQSVRNAQDGISFIQTAEGALDEVSGMLNRMRDLTVQAKNGTQDSNSRAAILAEFSQLTSAIDDIYDDTKFAGADVFAATPAGRSFQVGNSEGKTVDVAAAALTQLSTAAFAAVTNDGTTATDIHTDTSLLADIDTAISTVSTARGTLGASQNRLESTVRNLSVTAENLSAAESRIRDVDVAEEMMSFTRSQILQQAGTAMLAQANGVSQGALQLLG
jgi:flagellin